MHGPVTLDRTVHTFSMLMSAKFTEHPFGIDQLAAHWDETHRPSSRRPGEGSKALMEVTKSSDRSLGDHVNTRDHIGARRRQDPESGQAMVEFALVLLPLLLLVSGIIWFGIGLNFWLDMNRIANQGARWAVVNCGSPTVAAQVCNPSLETYLEQQTLSQGNNPDVEICYESMTGSPVGSAGAGDGVTVRLRQPFEIVPFLGIGIDLEAAATMRLEQEPDNPGLPNRTLSASACL